MKTVFFEPYGDNVWMRGWPLRSDGTLVYVVAALLAGVAGRRLFSLNLVFPATLAGSLALFAVAQSVPYRLYLPERIVQYAFPPLLLLGLLQVAYLAFTKLSSRHAGVLAALSLCVLELGFYGDGLTPRVNMWDWSAKDTPTVRFIGTLPKDVKVAASFDVSSGIQTFARRQVLFSSILNTPILWPMALELERRIISYYEAYFARDWAPVRRMIAEDHIDYLVVDSRDFGPDALNRCKYIAAWTAIARRQLTAGPIDQMIWAHPPDKAIVFRDGPVAVVDLRKL
jgi:hypothetical protein